jgi:hypothetical protein
MAVALKILVIDDDKVDLITIIRSISHSGILADVESAFPPDRLKRSNHLLMI